MDLPDVIKTAAGIPPARKPEMLRAAREGARQAFRLFLPKVLDAGKQVENQLEKVAGKYGIDPSYARFALGRGHLWPVMSAANKKLIGIAADVMKAGGEVPSYGTMTIPEAEQEEMALDMIFMDLAQWVETTLHKRMASAYHDAVWDVASDYTHILIVPGDKDDPRKQASGMINQMVQYQLARGGFGSPHKYAVLSVVVGLLRA